VSADAPSARGGRYVVDASGAGTRLDTFLARALGISATAARRLLAEDAVRVDGRRAAKGARVEGGAVIEVASRLDAAALVVPDPTVDVRVVYQDTDLVAVDKPAGIPSHPLAPGERGTAANAIVARFPECASASTDPREGGLGHRLDTPTSGVLIAARSRAVWTGLRRALAAPTCEKRYLCEVRGAAPDEGRIDLPIGRTGRRGKSVRTDGGRNPRAAETSWVVLERRGGTTLVAARLHAGRPHQVRVHMAAAGFPIVGDDLYGAVAGGPATTAPADDRAPAQLHLHAAAVRLDHPVTGRALEIEAPPPPWARPRRRV
jgi:23S rRNA pseudouridine1911/1915/1917 synthase